MNALLILFLAIDLASVKNEPNLERRSDLALDFVHQAIDAAREAYNAGDSAKMQAALEEGGQALEISYQALSDAVKNPRNSKSFKKAELRTRELIRRLDGLAQTVGVDDREAVAKLRDHVAEVHDDLLKGIMSKKK
ncbi:MAG: hypothetical protein LAO79_29300 [Acidobacteriia bacterium]|nr:hypothetical protein [Terriglobia bacterium]